MNTISTLDNRPAITRTERGLTIAGTRISLYDVMDFLKAQYPKNSKISYTFAQLKISYEKVKFRLS